MFLRSFKLRSCFILTLLTAGIFISSFLALSGLGVSLTARLAADEKLRPLSGQREIIVENQSVIGRNYNREYGKSVPADDLNYDVHLFYYPWYGNPEKDSRYLHWDHEYLEHWSPVEAAKWPKGRHVPPSDIGATYYPELGVYSSRNVSILHAHMQQIKQSKAGTIAVSWYPPGLADRQGRPWDDMIPILLDVAHQHRIKVCFHVEPFADRNIRTIRGNLTYLIDSYAGHPALFRVGKKPLFYLYDSYQVPYSDWSELLLSDRSYSLRGGKYDAIFVGLMVTRKDETMLANSGFDGMYTYFASKTFTYGSNPAYWAQLANRAKLKNMLFVPSVGPGYNDESIRPWNSANTHSRNGGRYFREMFVAAMNAQTKILSITSFNEWGEGTQIESAVPKMRTASSKYADYGPNRPDYYLQLTRQQIEMKGKLRKKLRHSR